MRLSWFLLVPILGLVITSFVNPNHASRLQASITSRKPSPSPTPPRPTTGPAGTQALPPGNRIPKNTLGPGSVCRNTTVPLTALVPVDAKGILTSSSLTLWFYVPYAPEEIQRFELRLVPRDEKRWVYKHRFTMTSTPGIIGVQLPSLPENKFEVGKAYRWYLQATCSGNNSPKPDLELNGWVVRESLTPDREAQINAASSETWYDSVNRLARLRLNAPQDPKLKKDWQMLLTTVQLGGLSEEKIVGVIELPSSPNP